MRRIDRCVAQLDRVVLDVQAGSVTTAVDVLKAVGLPLMRLQQEAEAGIGASAIGGMHTIGRILPCLGNHVARHLARNRRRDHVERAADGIGSLSNRRRPLNDLDSAQPTNGWEIVGRGCGVGRRCDQHVVFQERDAATALCGYPTNADIRSQAIAILDLNRHAGHFPRDALDIAVAKLLQLLGTDIVRGTGDTLSLFLAADDSDFFDSVATILGVGEW